MLDELRVLRDAVRGYRVAATAACIAWPERADTQDTQPPDLDLVYRLFDVDHVPEQLNWLESEGWDPRWPCPGFGYLLSWPTDDTAGASRHGSSRSRGPLLAGVAGQVRPLDTVGPGRRGVEEPMWYSQDEPPYPPHDVPWNASDASAEYREWPTAALPVSAADPVADPPGRTPAPGPDRAGIAITAAVVLVLLLCGGLVVAVRAGGGSTGATAGAAAPPASASPAASPSMPVKPSVTAHPMGDDRYVIVAGECVANDGTAQNPKLRPARCAPGAYYIVDRFDSTADVRKCEGKAGYTHDYYYETTPSSLDFVLCLKKL